METGLWVNAQTLRQCKIGRMNIGPGEKLKVSMCISTSKAEFDAVYKGELKETLETLSGLGYDGVELNLPEPRAMAPLERHLDSLGLEVSAIDTGLIYLMDKACLADRETRKLALGRFEEYAELASAFDALVVVGLMRGKIPKGLDRDSAWGSMLEGLRGCEEIAKEKNIHLGIEPLNRYETDLINTIAEASELVDELASPLVGIVADTFHMNIEESSMTDPLFEAGKRLIHVHLADSNRLAPGKGHIDFPGVISALKAIGYEGYLSFEIIPKPDPNTAAANAISYLKTIW